MSDCYASLTVYAQLLCAHGAAGCLFFLFSWTSVLNRLKPMWYYIQEFFWFLFYTFFLFIERYILQKSSVFLWQCSSPHSQAFLELLEMAEQSDWYHSVRTRQYSLKAAPLAVWLCSAGISLLQVLLRDPKSVQEGWPPSQSQATSWPEPQAEACAQKPHGGQWGAPSHPSLAGGSHQRGLCMKSYLSHWGNLLSIE